MKRLIAYLIAVSQLAFAAPSAAQSNSSAQALTQVPLRVQVVVSRSSGEKKVSSIPYTLSVIANDNDKTSVRMGVDVPVPQSVFKGGDNAAIPMTSYSYRSVGTNIDCTARTIEGGRFKLDLTVSDSSVFITDKSGPSATGVQGVPAFRSFTSSFNVLLTDGQTAQHTAATDPVSGEVLRVDVTVTVLK